MNFQKPIGPHDEGSVIFSSFFQDADAGFIGVDERTPPQWLPQGWCASGKNKRFRVGRAQDRGGITICRWCKGDGDTPFDAIYGGIVYGSPGANNTAKWILIAADGQVWKTQPNRAATPVPMPAGVVLDASSFTMMVQCMNVVVLLRGPGFTPLAMQDIDQGFAIVTQTQAGIDAGTTPIPNSSFGAYILNRLGLVQGRDFLACSDINDYTSYQEVTETFQINQGEADSLVAFALFNASQLICLKSGSVYLVDGLTAALSNATGPFLLTNEYGCVAPKTVVVRGTNVYWLAQPGVASVTLTQLNQTQAQSQMLSDPLIKTMARINPLYVANACAEIWNNRLYLGVPLDDAQITLPSTLTPVSTVGGTTKYAVEAGATYYWTPTAPSQLTDANGNILLYAAGYFKAPTNTVSSVLVTGNAGTPQINNAVSGANTGVLVYDFVNNAWCGSDEGAAVCPVQFLRLTWNGAEQLLALSADGWIRQWDVGVDNSPRAEDEVYVNVSAQEQYNDFILTGAPHPGDTIEIAGVALTVTNAAVNTPGTWGCQTQAIAIANLPLALAGGPQTFAAITDGVRVFNPPLDDGGMSLIFINGQLLAKGIGTYWFLDGQSGDANVIQTVPVQSRLVTRAYSCLDHDGKRYVTLLAIMATWNPNYTITTIVNGTNQTTAYLEDITKDRTLYDVQDLGPYVPSNVNADFAAAKRLDYSVCPDDLAPGGAGVIVDPPTLNFDQSQDTIERLAVDEKGLWMQVQFDNASGTLEPKFVLMEVLKGDRSAGAHV